MTVYTGRKDIMMRSGDNLASHSISDEVGFIQ